MNTTVFEAINITKKYRNTLALNQVSMSVMQGDIYGFIGENGAGKTTMIRLLTGLPLKIFVYGNPMYYWMNFCSCRTMRIIEHLPFYFMGGILLLIVGGIAMSKKEIK